MKNLLFYYCKEKLWQKFSAVALTLFFVALAIQLQAQTNVTSISGDPTNEPIIEFQIDFGTEVQNFSEANIATTNGMLNDFYTSDNIVYSVFISPVKEGFVEIHVQTLLAAYLNGDPIQQVSFGVVYDSTAPTPQITTQEPDPTDATSFECWISFGEEVTGVTNDDFWMSDGYISVFNKVAPGLYSFEVTGYSGDFLEMYYPMEKVTDLAGNLNYESNFFMINFGTQSNCNYDYYYTTSASGEVNLFFDQFSDLGANASLLWIIDGNELYADDAYPTHYFSEIGTHNVCLIINDDGQTCEVCKSIDISGPQCDFYIHKQQWSKDGMEYMFQAEMYNLSNPTWTWDFGDESTDMAQDIKQPFHRYQEPGIYTYCLTVSHDNGSCTKCNEVNVEYVNRDIQSYVAFDQLQNKYLFMVYDGVVFMQKFSSDGTLISHTRSRVDGNDYSQELILSNTTATSCTENGTYEYEFIDNYVVFNLISDDCQQRTDFLTNKQFYPQFSSGCGFTINHTISTTDGIVDLTLNSHTEDMANYHYVWDIGAPNGHFGENQQNVNQQLTHSGYYQPFVIANNHSENKTCIAAKDFMYYSNNCNFDFDVAPVSNNSFEVHAIFPDAHKYRGVAKFAWDFGDGNGFRFTGEEMPYHYYDDLGTYDVSLKLWSDNGECITTKQVEVGTNLEEEWIAYTNNKIHLYLKGDNYRLLEVSPNGDILYSEEGYTVADDAKDEVTFYSTSGDCTTAGTYMLNVISEHEITFKSMGDNCNQRTMLISNHTFSFNDYYNIECEQFDFTYQPAGNLDVQLAFDNYASVGSDNSFFWTSDFSSDEHRGNPNPIITLPEANLSFGINLNIRGNLSCTISKKVMVLTPDCNLDVYYGEAYEPQTLEFQFSNSYQYEGAEWYWDFGDNSNESAPNQDYPRHYYETPGIYTVCITVVKQESQCQKCFEVEVNNEGNEEGPQEWIMNNDNGNARLVFEQERYILEFWGNTGEYYQSEGNYYSDDTNMTIEFSDYTTSGCNDIGIYNYSLIEPFLTFTTIDDPCTSRMQPLSTGVYTFNGFLEDPCPYQVELYVANNGNEVDFSFVNNSDIPTDGSWAWVIDNLEPMYIDVANATHNFDMPGKHQISLVVNHPVNGECWKTKDVYILSPECDVYFDYSQIDSDGIEFELLNADMYQASGINWEWNFGDVGQWGNMNAYHTQYYYPAPGDYVVSVRMSQGERTCHSQQTIHVEEQYEGIEEYISERNDYTVFLWVDRYNYRMEAWDFSGDQLYFAEGYFDEVEEDVLMVNSFTDDCGNVPTYSITFDETSTGAIISFITDDDNCQPRNEMFSAAPFTHNGYVEPRDCGVHFYQEPMSDDGKFVQFYFETAVDFPDAQFWWDFGDGMGWTAQNNPSPKFIYDFEGYYNVCLKVVDANGKECIQCNEIYIGGSSSGGTEEYVSDRENTSVYFWVEDSYYAIEEYDNNWNSLYYAEGELMDMGVEMVFKINEYYGSDCIGSPVYSIEFLDEEQTVIQFITDNDDCTIRKNAFTNGIFTFNGAINDDCGLYFFNEPVSNDGTLMQFGLESAEMFPNAILNWDFGTGDKATTTVDDMPQYQYTETGWYTVCVVAVKDDGSECEMCNDIYVGTNEESYEEWSYIDATGNYVYLMTYSDEAELAVYDVNGKLKYNVGSMVNVDEEKMTVVFNDVWGNSCSAKGKYHFIMDEDAQSLRFEVINDPCVKRMNYLTGDIFWLNSTDYGCYAYFTSSSDGGNGIMLSADAIDETTSYYWDFGDNQFGRGREIYHLYKNSGAYWVSLYIENEAGCWNEYGQMVYIGEDNGLEALFDYKIDYVADPTGLTVKFFNRSTGEAKGFWEFGDGGVNNTDEFPIHTYDRAGWYTVCANVTNDNGEWDDYCMEIWVGPRDATGCSAKIIYEPTDEQNATYEFTAMADNADEYYWYFSDGGMYFTPNVTHTFMYEDFHSVCLGVYNSQTDCWAETCVDVTTAGSTDVEFCDVQISSRVIDKDNRVVQFNAKSEGVTEWFWDFGDGATADVQSPVHTYEYDEVFYVSLEGNNQNLTCFDYDERELFIQGATDAKLINPEFSYAIKGNAVKFTNKSTGNIEKYYWTFGDGYWTDVASPSHTYEVSDFYKVCLQVENQNFTERKCKEVQVGTIATDNTEGCKAEFVSFVRQQSVTFKNKSIGQVTDYFWDFGDNTTSFEKNPVKHYNKPGKYIVYMATKDATTGCTDFFIDIVTVGTVECDAAFDYNVEPQTNTVRFTNLSKGSNLSHFWIFDEFEFSEEKDPVITFDNAGKHYVGLLIVSDDGTCIDVVDDEIQVGKVDCNANFNAFVSSDGSQNLLKFKTEKTTFATTTKLEWNFGDGGYSFDQNPTYEFNHNGYFTVSLFVHDPVAGCKDHKEKQVLVVSANGDCEADFTYSGKAGSTKISFFNESKGENLTYKWDFDGLGKSNVENPEFDFIEPGFYNVYLTVKDAVSGIENFTMKRVKVAGDNIVNADFNVTMDIENKQVTFVNKSIGADEYEWNFGDGETSVEFSPTHTYNTTGYFFVVLKAKNTTSGKVSKFARYINVGGGEGLKGGYVYEEVETNNKYGGYPIDMVGAAFGDPAKVTWDFGDGDTSEGTLTPTHNYAEAGTYEVCFTVEDPVTGESNTTCQQVTIEEQTSIAEQFSNDARLDVLPNLITETAEITFGLPVKSDYTMCIYDLTGRTMKVLEKGTREAGIHRATINASDYAQGMYLLELKTPLFTKTVKFTIAK